MSGTFELCELSLLGAAVAIWERHRQLYCGQLKVELESILTEFLFSIGSCMRVNAPYTHTQSLSLTCRQRYQSAGEHGLL